MGGVECREVQVKIVCRIKEALASMSLVTTPI